MSEQTPREADPVEVEGPPPGLVSRPAHGVPPGGRLLINRTPNRPMMHHAETVRQISYMFLASLVSLVWLDCILSLRFHTFGIG